MAPFAIVFTVMHVLSFIERRMQEQDMGHQLWLGYVAKNMKENVHRIFTLLNYTRLNLILKVNSYFLESHLFLYFYD